MTQTSVRLLPTAPMRGRTVRNAPRRIHRHQTLTRVQTDVRPVICFMNLCSWEKVFVLSLNVCVFDVKLTSLVTDLLRLACETQPEACRRHTCSREIFFLVCACVFGSGLAGVVRQRAVLWAAESRRLLREMKRSLGCWWKVPGSGVCVCVCVHTQPSLWRPKDSKTLVDENR